MALTNNQTIKTLLKLLTKCLLDWGTYVKIKISDKFVQMTPEIATILGVSIEQAQAAVRFFQPVTVVLILMTTCVKLPTLLKFMAKYGKEYKD